MTHEPPEVLSAFLDGEAYEPDELAAALAAPGARESLIDFVLLRAGLTRADDRPAARFYAQMQQTLTARPHGIPWRQRWVPTLAAAAVVTFAAFGLWIAFKGGSAPVQPETPPVPVRTLHFVPDVHWQEFD